MSDTTRKACTAVIIILLRVTQVVSGRSAPETEVSPLQKGPTLILISPSDGSQYRAELTVAGEVSPSPDIGEGDQRIDTLAWEIPELDVRGYIMFHRSGQFYRVIPTGSYEKNLTLVLRLTDDAGRITERHVTLGPAPVASPAVLIPPPAKPTVEPILGGPLVIFSPSDGSFYRSFVEVLGRAEGQPDRISWRVDALDAEGPIESAPDGTYRFAFTTTGYSEPIEIVVTAVYPDREATASIRLENIGDGPYLGVDRPDDGAFYRNLLEVSGTVGRDPEGDDGLEDVKGLYWWFATEPERRRPVFFDGEGRFSFEIDLSEDEGSLTLKIEAEDKNGNTTNLNFRLDDGRLPPDLEIGFPGDGTLYGAAGLLMTGTVKDPYEDAVNYGGLKDLQWSVRPTDPRLADQAVTGTASIGSDVGFAVPLLLQGLSGEIELSVIAAGFNDAVVGIDMILPRGVSDIPSFFAVGLDGSAKVTWDTVPDALEYIISISRGDEVSEIRLRPEDGNETVLESLENGVLYELHLTATTPRGEFNSHVEKAIPLSGETLKPAARGEFRQIRLSWEPVPGAEAYLVYRSEEGGKLYHLLGDPVEETRFVDSSARYGIRYAYAVAPAAFPEFLSDPTLAETLQAPEQKLEEVARYEGLVPHDLLIQGDYAFVAAGSDGFRIIDITNPVKPMVVGEAAVGDARGVAVRGDYAYLADGDRGLQIVNITAPVSPLTVGSRLAGTPVAVAIRGVYAYVADADRGLRVYDVSNAREPRRIHILEGFGAMDLTVADRWAYVPAGPDGLAIIDLEKPDRPVLTAMLPIGDTRKVAVEDSLVCVSDSGGNLILIDVSDPASPGVLSRIPGTDVGHFTIKNGYLFLSSIEGGLAVYDARDPTSPRFFESSPLGDLGSLDFKDDYLYAGTPTGIIVIQTYLVGASYATTGWETPGRSHGLSLSEYEIVVADHEGGVRIHVMGAEDGEPIQIIPSPFAVGTAISDNMLVVADSVRGLSLHIRDTDGISWSESVLEDSTSPASDVDIFNTYAAGSLPDSGLYVMEVSDDGSIIGSTEIPFPGACFVALGDGLLAAADNDGIRIYEIGDKLSIRETTQVEIKGVKDLEISGMQLYAAGSFGMTIFDLSTPGRADLISTYSSSYTRDVSVSGAFAYLSAGPEGLLVVNVRNPSQPFLASRCPEVFAVAAEASSDGITAYVADTNGVKVVDLVIPLWLR